MFNNLERGGLGKQRQQTECVCVCVLEKTPGEKRFCSSLAVRRELSSQGGSGFVEGLCVSQENFGK